MTRISENVDVIAHVRLYEKNSLGESHGYVLAGDGRKLFVSSIDDSKDLVVLSVPGENGLFVSVYVSASDLIDALQRCV